MEFFKTNSAKLDMTTIQLLKPWLSVEGSDAVKVFKAMKQLFAVDGEVSAGLKVSARIVSEDEFTVRLLSREQAVFLKSS